jgi:pimeloyl-ACP methyl ester carboxylesterase
MLSQGTAQKMVAKLPRGSLAEIPHAGHTVVGDNPKGFEAALRQFLMR